MSKIVFVTGIESGVGKTHAAGWLARRLLMQGDTVITQKFIQTGLKEGVPAGIARDVAVHRHIMGIEYQPVDIDGSTSPVILSKNVGPRLASSIEGKEIDFRLIDKSTRKLKKHYENVIIEGTGGLGTPLTDDMLTLDYIQNRNLPVVLVTSGREGSLSHTVLALDTIRRRNIRLEGVCYNEYFDTDPDVARDAFGFLEAYLNRNFRKVPLLRIPVITNELLNNSDIPHKPRLPRRISISKIQLSELPQVTFPGKIKVIEDESDFADAISWLSRQKMVGFDTETRPSFRKGKMYPPALMQISTARKCYLFRLNKIGFPAWLREFLEKETVVKVGLSLRDDFTALRRREPDFDPQGFVDLQTFVRDYDIIDSSLQKIYGIIFGKRISKNQRLSNWEADNLTDAQQVYAAIDAWASLRIYQYLEQGKFDPASSKYILPDETI